MSKRGKQGRGIFVLIIIGSLCLGLVALFAHREESLSPVLLHDTASVTPFISQTAPTDRHLSTVVNGALAGTTGTYGVVIKNLKTNETYYRNEHRSFEAASLYKLWVMATVIDRIEHGQLTLSQQLRQDVAVLNEKFNISSESAELTVGTVSFSVADALDRMITVSHNYAALLLSERVKLSAVRQWLADHAFTESVVGEPPTTTPYDIALFFEKLYNGKLAGETQTKQMIDMLKRQTLNNKLPKDLPPEVPIAHKTGELGLFTHDAGIVYGPKSDYIIVILSESTFPSGAEDRIAGVSKAVYEYFEGTPR